MKRIDQKQSAIHSSKDSADRFWTETYDRLLKTGDSSLLWKSMELCNIADEANVRWLQRETRIQNLHQAERMTDEEFERVEEHRKLLLKMVQDLIKQRQTV